MKHWKTRLFALFLLIVLLTPAAACAEFTTPSPTPSPTQYGFSSSNRSDKIERHLYVEFLSEGEWKELERHLIYSHEKGIFADGILMFAPLSAYLEQIEIDEVTYSGEPVYRLHTDEYLDDYSFLVTITGTNQDGEYQRWDESVDLSTLPSGTYFVRFDLYGTHLEGTVTEYYKGISVLNLIIP